jgi:hypothetical protein
VLIVGLWTASSPSCGSKDLLPGIVGQDLADDLGKSRFRGAYVHMPLIALSVVIAAFTRTLGFTWLALLVVVAELADRDRPFRVFLRTGLPGRSGPLLVRRPVPVRQRLYAAGRRPRAGGRFYAGNVSQDQGLRQRHRVGCTGHELCAGHPCLGMGGKQNIINSPILTYEVTQAGFGLYVKYLMAGFLGVFAVSMMIQFVAYFLDADCRYPR